MYKIRENSRLQFDGQYAPPLGSRRIQMYQARAKVTSGSLDLSQRFSLDTAVKALGITTDFGIFEFPEMNFEAVSVLRKILSVKNFS